MADSISNNVLQKTFAVLLLAVAVQMAVRALRTSPSRSAAAEID